MCLIVCDIDLALKAISNFNEFSFFYEVNSEMSLIRNLHVHMCFC